MNIVDIQCRTTSMNLGCRIMEIRILPGKFKKRRSRHGYKHISFKAASGSEQNLNKKCVLSDLPRNPRGHYDVPEKMASCCIMVSCAIKNMEAISRLRHKKKSMVYTLNVRNAHCHVIYTGKWRHHWEKFFYRFFFRSKVHVHKVFQRSSLFAVWSNEWVSLVCPRQMQIGRPLCRILWRSQSFWGNAEW